jgi:hypothetical protein
MKLTLVVSLIVAAIFTPAAAALTATVTVTGRIDYAGEPPPGYPNPVQHAPWRVERHGRTVMSGRTDRNGMFRLHLRAGRYRVIVKEPFGRRRDCGSRSLTVKHSRVFVHLYCAIK